MTFKEFELHRPKLARLLTQFANGKEVRSVLQEVEPELFSALIGDDEIAVCVSPNHPACMREEEAPGVPTWWWQSDLEGL